MICKGEGFPYSLPSVGPIADAGVQAVSPQVTISHPPCGRLPLLFARPAVTFPATKHHRPLAGTKLYCSVTEAHRCELLVQGCYAALPSRIWTHDLLITSPTLYPLRHCATLDWYELWTNVNRRWVGGLTSSWVIGSRMVVVATLLVNVVNVVPMRMRIRTMTDFGNVLNTARELPSTFDSPDICTTISSTVTIAASSSSSSSYATSLTTTVLLQHHNSTTFNEFRRLFRWLVEWSHQTLSTQFSNNVSNKIHFN